MSIPEPLAENQVSDEIKGIFRQFKTEFWVRPQHFRNDGPEPRCIKDLITVLHCSNAEWDCRRKIQGAGLLENLLCKWM